MFMASKNGQRLGFLQDLILLAAAVSACIFRISCILDTFQKPLILAFVAQTHRFQNVSIYYLVRYALSRMEPEEDKKRKAGAAAVLQKLDERERIKDLASGDLGAPQRSRKEDLVLNQYEQVIASEVIAPEDIPVSFDGTLWKTNT